MRHNKFTLVELLVVICIASLLMGVVLPAFSRMVTGSAVDRLASNLKLRLERAQSHAASSRRHVALILPSGTTTTWTDPKEQAARLGGSRMCYVEWSPEDSIATFKRWVPDEEWSTPERGAFLVFVTNDPTAIAASGSPQNIGSNANDLKLIRDLYNGSAAAAAKPLKDVDGTLSPGSTASPTKCAIVFSPNGNVRSTDDVYLVIAEAMSDGTNLFFPGGAVHNFRVLKINHLTGKVEYYR